MQCCNQHIVKTGQQRLAHISSLKFHNNLQKPATRRPTCHEKDEPRRPLGWRSGRRFYLACRDSGGSNEAHCSLQVRAAMSKTSSPRAQWNDKAGRAGVTARSPHIAQRRSRPLSKRSRPCDAIRAAFGGGGLITRARVAFAPAAVLSAAFTGFGQRTGLSPGRQGAACRARFAASALTAGRQPGQGTATQVWFIGSRRSHTDSRGLLW